MGDRLILLPSLLNGAPDRILRPAFAGGWCHIYVTSGVADLHKLDCLSDSAVGVTPTLWTVGAHAEQIIEWLQRGGARLAFLEACR